MESSHCPPLSQTPHAPHAAAAFIAAAASSAVTAAEAHSPTSSSTFDRTLLAFTHVAGVRHWQKRANAKAALLIARAASAPAAASTDVAVSPPQTELKPGQALLPQREPDNPRDPHAIQLLLPSQVECKSDASAAAADTASIEAPIAVGHLPAGLARSLSPLISRGLVSVDVVVSVPIELDVDAEASTDQPATFAAPRSGGKRAAQRVAVIVTIKPHADAAAGRTLDTTDQSVQRANHRLSSQNPA